MFKITSYWAAKEVTWSKHLIEVWWKRILLDCWLFQWKRDESTRKNKDFGFDPSSVDALIVSHAHIDHSGLIPLFVKKWFTGPIYTTVATKDLLEVMLFDSAHIQESDFEYFNKHKELSSLHEKEPLYTSEDVQPALDLIKEYELHKEFFIWNVRAKFFWAGHILWAAMVMLEYQWKTLLFSWDLWRKNVPMLINSEHPSADIVIMESTYWWRKHDPVDLNVKSLIEVINKTASRWWKIIIPSFAVERTQELLFYIEQAFEQNAIPSINIYVDSPMATRVTDIFRKHTQCYNEEMQNMYESSIPFQNTHIVYTQSVDESKALNDIKMPCVIISASWMIEAWRIRHHIANSIEDYRNTILIVWFMAQDTLWRKLVEKASSVKVLWKTYQVKAEIKKLNSFSGHADEDELMMWFNKMQKPQHVVLVHWEDNAIKAMSDKISALWIDVNIAEFWKTIEF